MIKIKSLFALVLCSMLAAEAIYAAKPVREDPPAEPTVPVIEATAEKVELRMNCTVNGTLQDNCFTTFPELSNWMATVRKPNALNPLHVNIGPGTFTSEGVQLGVNCSPVDGFTGYTTFSGSGSSQTQIKGTYTVTKQGVFLVQNCTDLNFSDLTITTDDDYTSIYWRGGGNSRWTNVTVNANGIGWFEDNQNCAAERGNHYWFSSKVNLIKPMEGNAAAYIGTCDETWFFGSEVKTTVPAGFNSSYVNGVAHAMNRGIIHLYGSNLVSISDSTTSVPAAVAQTGGNIHIHGTGIDVINTSGGDVVALYAYANSSIHANESAYNMQTTGTISRIINAGGSISAPYQWKQSGLPPAINSEHGADSAIVTNTLDGQPHPVIYSENCASKWYDTVTTSCF